MRAVWGAMFVAFGCGGTPRVPAPAPVPPLVHGGNGADIDQLVNDFYGEGLAPDRARARAADVLRDHPNASRAHEVAAWADLLSGNTEGAWLHSLKAAADLDADVTELYLGQLGADPRSRAEVSMQLLDELRRGHPRPAVRVRAAAELAELDDMFGRLAEAETLSRSIGYIDDFELLGSLDNEQGKGFLTKYPPEEKIDIGVTVPGPLVPLKWRRVHGVNRLGAVPLGDLLWPNDSGVAYLATWVHSDGERAAELRITAGCPTRAFVNDGLVLSEEQIVGGEFDNLVAPIRLHAGWNQLLLKLAQRRGRPWTVRARIAAEDGSPSAGLSYSGAPQPYQKDPGRERTDTPAPSSPALGPLGRQSVIEALRLSRAGQKRRALAAIQTALDASPKNPLCQYLAAMSHWDNDETGKTIDLLNRSIRDATSPVALVLTKRGRYYAQQHLFEQAQTDLLRAAALGDFAEPELADLFDKRGWQTDRCHLLARVLKRRPDSGWALRERAECLDSLGYLPEAERSFELATSVRPGDRDAWRERLQLAFRRGDFSVARNAIRALEDLDPVAPRWLVEESELLRRTGKPNEARARLTAAARLSPEWPRPWEQLGNLAHEHGAESLALSDFSAAGARDPSNAAIAQRIEFLAPTRLGFIEKFVPKEDEIDRALRAPRRASSGAQMALLLDHEVTEIAADGSARRLVTKVTQALDDKGRDAMTLERLPPGGSLKILRAYALDEKGERHEASSIRGTELRFRNLQPGSKTVLQYLHRTRGGAFLPGAFATEWSFQQTTADVERSTWVVVLPRGGTLHHEFVGHVDLRHMTDADREVFTFEGGHVPHLENEPTMPPLRDVLTHAAVSTVTNWDDYVRWERAILADAFRSDSSLDQVTDGLVRGAVSPRDKLDRLFRYVTREVRYQQDYETPIAGVRPHAAPVVLERGYGDCKDKVVLLVQMAHRVGLRLHFAILRTTNYGQVMREVPNQQFNHAIVWVPKQDGINEPFFLDPTADGLDLGNLPPVDQGALSLVVDPETGTWEFRDIPYQAPELQYDHHSIKVRITSPTEASLTDEMSLRGGRAMYVRQLLQNPSDAHTKLEGVAASLFPAARVEDVSPGDAADLAHPLAVTFRLDGAHMLHPEENSYRFSVPGYFDLSRAVTLSKRTTPVFLGAPDSSLFDADVTLPDGFEVSRVPPDFTVTHPCFTLARRGRVEGLTVKLRTEYSRSCPEVSVLDYPEFRDAVERAAHALTDDLVFRKKTGPAPKASAAKGAKAAPHAQPTP